MTNLPGRCMGCGADVWYRGRSRWGVTWRNAVGQGHVCPTSRDLCGAFMPRARERCVLRPDHREDRRWKVS